MNISMALRCPALVLLCALPYAESAAQSRRVPLGTVVMAPAGRVADSILTAATKQGFAGVVLVRRNGEVLLRRGYGLANRAASTKFTPGTVVQIGSNTKDFTKVAVLQLRDAGKLRLVDTIGRFLPNVPADKRGISVQQLLYHRAGFPIGVGPDFEPISRGELIARAMATPLKFAPGSAEQYSNTGYSLLAAIIEIVAQQPYDAYLQEHVFTPVGMAKTGLLLPHFSPADLAHGLEAGTEFPTMLERPHASDGSHWNLRGNGGLLSTVDDMAAFYDTLFTTERLLSREMRAEFFPDEPVVLAGSDMVNFFLYNREPQSGLVMVMASNVAEHPAPKVHRALLAQYSTVRMADSGPRTAPDAPAIALPNTPVGQLAAQWLHEMMAGDAVSLGQFLSEKMAPNAQDNRSLEDRVKLALSRRVRLGTLVPVAFVAKSATVLEVRCRTGEGDPATLTFEMEAAAPFRLLGVRMIVGE